MPHFADTTIERARRLGHPLCLGLDPHLERIPSLFRRGDMEPRDPQTAVAVREFLVAVLDRAADEVVCVKPQSAFFERLGPPGLAVLDAVVEQAHARGLPVLLDAKRGDVGSTAEAYAAAYLDPGAPLAVDAITLNPYLGRDTLEPFVARGRRHGRGLFVLVKTSNPGSGDYQDLTVDGAPLYEAVARSLAPLAQELQGATGWSCLGVVVGATYPQQAERIRTLLPTALQLVPGYGAQGGAAADAVRNFVAGPRGLEGGLVNSSRGILFPPTGDGAGAWERALDGALERACHELGEAVAKAPR